MRSREGEREREHEREREREKQNKNRMMLREYDTVINYCVKLSQKSLLINDDSLLNILSTTLFTFLTVFIFETILLCVVWN